MNTSPNEKDSPPRILDMGFICSLLFHAPSPLPLGRGSTGTAPTLAGNPIYPLIPFPCPSPRAAGAHRMFSDLNYMPHL